MATPLPPEVIQQIMEKIEDTIKAILQKCRTNDLGSEESITNQLIGQLEARIDDITIEGFKLEAKEIGKKEESEIGADIFFILQIKSEEYDSKKGVLIQAKLDKTFETNHRTIPIELVDTSAHIPLKGLFRYIRFKTNNRKEFLKLHTQCEDMLDNTSQSYVFIYSKDKFVYSSASNVIAISDTIPRPFDVPSFYLSDFFHRFLACLIGDEKLGIMDVPDILEYIKQRNIGRAFRLRIIGEGNRWEENNR